MIVGSALPWFGLGGVNRSAFTLARVANEMGVFEKRSQRIVVYSLWCTPVFVPLALVLFSVGWRRSSAVCLFLVGLIGTPAGFFALKVSIGREVGPMVTAVGGLLALLGSILLGGFSRSIDRRVP